MVYLFSLCRLFCWRQPIFLKQGNSYGPLIQLHFYACRWALAKADYVW
jgi:hypothetical protein